VLFPQPSGPPSDGSDQRVCSARGCRADGVWALRWNNPRLHTPERRKTWLACDDHRTSLSEFLSLRGFLREVVGIDALDDGTPDGDAPDGRS
jgi:hypothetical protein